MRTESKVDSIVLDWLREGLSEKLDQLLRALEDLSGGTGGAEHIYESLQAVKTMDSVLSIADFQILRVLLKEEMAALILLETKPPQAESLLYAVTEVAWLLGAIFDRLSIGATVNAMSLLPMINRLRSAQGLPTIDVENVLARASIIWSESRVASTPYHAENGVPRTAPERTAPKALLTQMEQQILQLLRGNAEIIPDLLNTFDVIIDHEVNPAVIVATRVFEELLSTVHGNPAEYLSLAQRMIGRILKLFRMELQGREDLQIRNEAIEFATDLLLELLKVLPDDRMLCGEPVQYWHEMLSTTNERKRFLGLESATLKQVAEALSEELNAAQDVLDIFVRGAKTDLEPLVRIQPRLEQIIGVLDTLNYADEATLIRAALDRLVQVVRGAVLLDDDFLMELAVAVMTSEQVVSQIGQFIVEVGDRPSMIDRVVRQSRLALATACYEDILAAKEIVNKSLSAIGQAPSSETLADAVGLVHGVRNALTVAELTAAMPLIDGLHVWLASHASHTNKLTPRSMAALAEVSAAIEFYLENLRDYQKELIQYLDGAKALLPALLASSPSIAAAEDLGLEMTPSEVEPASTTPVGADTEALELGAGVTSNADVETLSVDLEPALPIDESLASIDDLIAQMSEAGDEPVTEEAIGPVDLEMPQDSFTPQAVEESDEIHAAEMSEPLDLDGILQASGTEPDEGTTLLPLGQVPEQAPEESQTLDFTASEKGPESEFEASSLELQAIGTEPDEGTTLPLGQVLEQAPEESQTLDFAAFDKGPESESEAPSLETWPLPVDAPIGIPLPENAEPTPSVEEITAPTVVDETDRVSAPLGMQSDDTLDLPEFGDGIGLSADQQDLNETVADERTDVRTADADFGAASDDLPIEPLADLASPLSTDASQQEPLDPMALEMRMVFAEEMAETIPVLQEATARWLASGDGEDLTVIRRCFHTIKGSSRMVGLAAIGDWAWAYENLLTRVLDNRIASTAPLRSDVDSAVQRVATALPVLQQGQEPPVTFWGESLSAAERWLSTENLSSDGAVAEVGEFDEEMQAEPVIESDDRMTLDQVGAVADMSAPDESITTGSADSIPEAIEESLETAAMATPDSSADTSFSEEMHSEGDATAETILPVIEDPILREIFDTESSGYIQQLQQQVDHAMDNHLPLTCDKELVRLVHTLLGSARTAGVQPIAHIADRLEEWVQLLEEHQQALEYVNLDIFRQALSVMDQIRHWAINPNFPQPDPEFIEARIALEIDEALANVVPEPDIGESSAGVEVVEDTEDMMSMLTDVEQIADEAQPNQPLTPDAEEPLFGQQPVADFLLAPRPDDQPSEQDPDILQIFLEEAEELLEKADGYIAHWRTHPHDLDSIRLLHRNLHTLKGGARMAGLLNLADVTHLLEDRLDRARDQGGERADQLIMLVQQTYDALGKMLDLVRHQEPVPAQVDLLAMIVEEQAGRKLPPTGAEIVRVSATTLAPETRGVEPSVVHLSPEPVEPVAASSGSEEQPPAATQITSATAAEVRREQIRVDADRIDDLVNQVGESVLLQARVDRQVSGFERQLFELQQTLTRLRGQLRRLEIETESQMKAELMAESGLSAEEFDPLEFDRFTHVQELSRGIMESLGDISSIEEAMSDLTEQSQLLLLQQSRLGRKLQDGMLALRMVRFNDVVGRLRRIVRQVGDEVGRSADLVVHNGETELDRVTLVGLLPSLEHMIRNSLAHGIEQPEERLAKGKPETGKIEITIESSGGNVTLELKDDGRGLDLDTIRRKAIERKLISDDIELTDDEARSLIFLPGFSTAGNVSQVAGRGVGMDVVAGSVREMGGFVDLQSEYGVYTRIQLNLPLTQAMTRGILVSVGDERFAIPYKGVVSVTRMTTIQLAEQYASDKPAVMLNGERYPLFNLGELMTHEAFNSDSLETGIRPVFLFKLGERRFAIQVDHQLGGIQLFVKSLGPQLGRVPGLSGATIADDGNVILVLELFELVRQFQRRDDREVDLTAVLEARRRPVVLVVDDSLTVRKVTARTLERNNLDVILARDGVEALGVLHEQRPDLVLTDIEMPRMDGFELLGAIRNDPQTRAVPVIMISSRTGQKHRSRAETLGVSAYLGKPYAEADLINRIEQFIADKRGKFLSTQVVVKGDEA